MSDETSITPGPWTYWSDGCGHFGWTGANGKPANTKADQAARTAAPDLLEALLQAVSTIEQLVPSGVPHGVIDAVLFGARAAIAKAEAA